MEYFIIVIKVLLILIGIGFVHRLLKRVQAYYKVRKTSIEEKEKIINEHIEEAGFLLDAKENLFYSKVDAWQKHTGYCNLYDKMAPLFRMLIDCEPIYYTYAGMVYRIEFWKGQYGMATGAEIGIYKTSEEEAAKSGGYENAFYQGLEDYHEFYLYYKLLRGEEVLAERSDRHWWLTAFCLGKYSRQEALKMEVEIMFPNPSMSYAFYQGLLRTGYSAGEIKYSKNIVAFTFSRARSRQYPLNKIVGAYIRNRNRHYIRVYNRYTRKYETTVDKLFFMKYCFPRIFKNIFRLGRSVRFFRRMMNDFSQSF